MAIFNIIRAALRNGTHPRRARPRLECLEDRTAPAAYFVTNTNDAGPGSLRDAINQVNAGAFDAINFDIGPAGSQQTIHVGSAGGNPLPALTRSGVTIDGSTQPGSASRFAPLIVLDGSQVANLDANGEAPGLDIEASNVTIRRLTIENFLVRNVSGPGGPHDVGVGVLLDGSNDALTDRCLIGTTPDGLAAAGNDVGVRIGTQAATTVPTGDTVSGDVISGNASDGVEILNASSNTVSNDLIGLGVDGVTALGNGNDGVSVLGQGSGNLITADTISANAGGGVRLNGVSGDTVAGNFIGLAADGMTARGNGGNGVSLINASGNAIGLAGDANVISGNAADGVVIAGAGARGNQIAGNLIGLNAAGNAPIANGTDGVDVVAGASDNTIGGAVVGPGGVVPGGNTIGGNAGNGVHLAGVGTSGNLVAGNFIGLNAAGHAPIANGGDGVRLDSGASNNTIGNAGGGAGNTISGNVGNGAFLTGAGTSGNLIAGNFIGLNAPGDAPIANGVDGVRLDSGASNNTIGGQTSGLGNVIAFNAKGVVVAGASTVGDSILGNSIHDNAGLGIDLGDDGITPNGTAPPGPNHFQNFPVLTQVDQSGASVTVVGFLQGAPGATYTIEFFANAALDPSGFGQGERLLGSVQAVADMRTGLAQFHFTFNQDPNSPFVTATATSAAGDTSEFSLGVRATVVAAVPLPTALLISGGPVVEGGTTTVSFLNAFDPSAADRAAGFHFAYDFDNDGDFDLGDGTYAGSVAASSVLIPLAFLGRGPGDYIIHGRIIAQDGGFTDYTVVVTVLPLPVVPLDTGTTLELLRTAAPAAQPPASAPPLAFLPPTIPAPPPVQSGGTSISTAAPAEAPAPSDRSPDLAVKLLPPPLGAADAAQRSGGTEDEAQANRSGAGKALSTASVILSGDDSVGLVEALLKRSAPGAASPALRTNAPDAGEAPRANPPAQPQSRPASRQAPKVKPPAPGPKQEAKSDRAPAGLLGLAAQFFRPWAAAAAAAWSLVGPRPRSGRSLMETSPAPLRGTGDDPRAR
jgi:hypothetical protein